MQEAQDISVKKRWKSAKKNGKVSGPGLYKRILLVQKQPNKRQVSKSVPLNFLVYSLLLFGCVANMAKCNQMMPSAKVFCWCVQISQFLSVQNLAVFIHFSAQSWAPAHFYLHYGSGLKKLWFFFFHFVGHLSEVLHTMYLFSFIVQILINYVILRRFLVLIESFDCFDNILMSLVKNLEKISIFLWDFEPWLSIPWYYQWLLKSTKKQDGRDDVKAMELGESGLLWKCVPKLYWNIV